MSVVDLKAIAYCGAARQDAAAVLVAVTVAYAVRFDIDGAPRVSGAFSPSYLLVSVALMVAWLGVLVGGRSRDRRLVGSGPAEYARVFALTWRLFAGVAIIAYMLRMEIGRGYLAIAAPLGLTLLLLERFWWRQWLRRRRTAGEYRSGILVVGHRGKAAQLIETFHRNLARIFHRVAEVGRAVVVGAA